ncbi:MAG: hypothetical protein AAGF74_07325 [Pseudomonadota bacterium]
MFQRLLDRIDRNRIALSGLAAGAMLTLLLGLLGGVIYSGKGLGDSGTPVAADFIY